MAVPEDEFDPYQNTHLLMWSHILQKGFQGGSLVGGVAIGPVLAYRAGHWPVVVSTAGKSAVVGVLLSGCLGFCKLCDQSHEAVADRVYRLHYHENQNRTDVFSQIGAAAGSGIAAAMASQGLLPTNAWTVLGGAAVGTAVGLLAHGATAPEKDNSHKGVAGLKKDVENAVEAMK